jgi:hypothetical protein
MKENDITEVPLSVPDDIENVVRRIWNRELKRTGSVEKARKVVVDYLNLMYKGEQWELSQSIEKLSKQQMYATWVLAMATIIYATILFLQWLGK